MTPAAEAPQETIPLAAMQAAVALLARHRAPEVPRNDVLGDHDPADVLAGMESIAGGLLAGVWPGDEGEDVLERIGLAVARDSGPCGHTPPSPPGNEPVTT